MLNIDQVSKKMDAAIDNLESNLRTLRTGRANASLLERVRVDYYGEPTPINQIAQISVVEGTQLVIKPYERSMVKDITHAIAAANLGLNPTSEADVVRIQVPTLTETRRKELAKEAKKYGDQAKVAIRNIRRDVNNATKKEKDQPEDMVKDFQKQVQDLTDKYVKKIDKIVSDKEKDIMTV